MAPKTISNWLSAHKDPSKDRERRNPSDRGLNTPRLVSSAYRAMTGRSPRKGNTPAAEPMPSLFLTKLPVESRRWVYEIVLARVKHATLPHQICNVSTTWRPRDPTAIRFVCRQIAQETFPYIFETFDFGWMVDFYAPEAYDHRIFLHPEVDQRNLRSVVRRRWSCIKHFEVDIRYLIWGMTDWLLQPTPAESSVIKAYKRAIRLYRSWDTLGWPIDERKVFTMTLYDIELVDLTLANRPGISARLDNFLVHLTMISHFYPLLKELRLVRRLHPPLAPTSQRCRIVGDEVRNWNTDQLKWRMPGIASILKSRDLWVDVLIERYRYFVLSYITVKSPVA
ncbi:uncharacterized protein LTR77_007506 [Saxophila tyrrhenica]|uniref:Uncharacterized protein n=1 Tax=Saxophila tyrrhenica TaxID=1690608 RepID=A0AAV9P8N6_9PEZI|nr:hypothetical protein LTR77_007506 [Saxophila tyrrhenica]